MPRVAATERLHRLLRGQNDAVVISREPDGRYAASYCTDGRVKVHEKADSIEHALMQLADGVSASGY